MTEYRHIPGVTGPGYVQRPDGAYVPAGGPDVGINRWGEPEYPPEPDPVSKHGTRWTVVENTPYSGIEYKYVPRCPWDGAVTPYVIEARYYSFGNPPDPAYLFECPLCSWEDEIS